MTTKRTLWLAIGAAALLSVLITGGALNYYYLQHPREPDWDAFEGTGHRGQVSTGGPDGQVAISTPFWSKGNRLVLSGYSEFPGKPRGAAYLLLVRLATNHDSEMRGGTRAEGGAHIVDQYFTAGDGKPFKIQYTLTKKPISEEFVLGEKTYALDAGRVFLLDLRATPVKVTQLKEEPDKLLPVQEPTKADFQKAVTLVQERHDSARTFWQAK